MSCSSIINSMTSKHVHQPLPPATILRVLAAAAASLKLTRHREVKASGRSRRHRSTWAYICVAEYCISHAAILLHVCIIIYVYIYIYIYNYIYNYIYLYIYIYIYIYIFLDASAAADASSAAAWAGGTPPSNCVPSCGPGAGSHASPRPIHGAPGRRHAA